MVGSIIADDVISRTAVESNFYDFCNRKADVPIPLIEQLEASLEAPPTEASGTLANELAEYLLSLSIEAPQAERENAVRGLTALNQHYYRTGELLRAGATLATAHRLAHDLPAPVRVAVLLRLGKFELLNWDVGAAINHTAAAMETARAARLGTDEAKAWTNYASALQAAGLTRQADERLAHALELIVDLDEPQLRGNIWALRGQLGCHLVAKDFQAAAHAHEQTLICAELIPMRYRDPMASAAWCNLAALEILRGDAGKARHFLSNAAARANLGARTRWLIAVLEAMAAVLHRNGPAERETLDTMLATDSVAGRAYVMECYSVMSAMYTAMGDGDSAHHALTRLSAERARALWATLATPEIFDANRSGNAVTAHRVTTMDMFERLAITAELRDDATGKHCFRVGRMSMLLARRAGLPVADIEEMELAARLHDIGKFAIPDAILLKPGHLDPAEMQLMRTHTTIGADLLAAGAAGKLEAAESIARHHHEWWDGSGYPLGLAGEQIPLAARIAALADVYDALSHARPYKIAWSHEDTVAYIEKMRGTQFDPRLTDQFLGMMTEAKHDLAAFLARLEDAAAASPYVVAESRIAQVLGGSAARH